MDIIEILKIDGEWFGEDFRTQDAVEAWQEYAAEEGDGTEVEAWLHYAEFANWEDRIADAIYDEEYAYYDLGER